MTPETAPDPATDAASRPARRALAAWPIIAMLAVLLLGWQWFETRQRLLDMQAEVRQQLEQAQQERGAQQALREQVESLHSRLGALDARFEEFAGQGDALRSLFQDMHRSREDLALIEVEQAIALAAQQLQLSANVPAALLALRSADGLLARLDRAEHLPLRKTLARDIERLNALPKVDVTGISLQLEQVVAGSEQWPLAALARPASGDQLPAEAGEGAPVAAWQLMLQDAWRELRSLVRIQRFDQAAAPLLAPGQEFFLRENLKLRLLNARLALFARDQTTFRNELKVAGDWLAQYFAAAEPRVAAAVASLRQLQGLPLAVDVPDLRETQQALAALRPRKDKR